jgi:hypothetical protein
MAAICTDDATLELIVRMQQEDVEYLKANAKGKQREDEMNDEDIALQFYLQELSKVGVFASDRTTARSIQSAVVTDSDAICRHIEEETTAARDHAMAVALSQGAEAPSVEPEQPVTYEDELVQKLSHIYLSVDSTEDSDAEGDGDSDGDETVVAAESSSWAASRKHREPPEHECMACGKSVPFIHISRAPCSHEYCSDCLEQLFKNAMVDESLFPPRCCKQTIPLENSILFLKQSTVTEFRKKRQEFATPNRTYCHRPQCAVFIPAPNYINGAATCTECKASTCTTCKGGSHGNSDCPHDEQLQQVLDTARREGWQRCQRCWTMVELNVGCNHMTYVTLALNVNVRIMADLIARSVAGAVPSSAIFVALRGNSVVVRTGTSIACSSEQLRLMSGIIPRRPAPPPLTAKPVSAV